jgi:hypothetical protein
MPRNYKYKEEGINLIKADGTIDVFDLCMLKKALISAEQTGG